MGRLVTPIECTVATRFTYRRVSAATHDLVEGRLGPITRGICELVATRCWRARRRAPSTLTRLRMPGLRRRFDTCVAQPWLLPPSFLCRRLVRFGPDPTKVNAHSLASLAPSCAAGYSASVPTRRMELRTASPPSLRPQRGGVRTTSRPDDCNPHGPALRGLTSSSQGENADLETALR